MLHHPLKQAPQQLARHSFSYQDQAILLSCQMPHQLHHLLWSLAVCTGQDYVQERVDCDHLENTQLQSAMVIALVPGKQNAHINLYAPSRY